MIGILREFALLTAIERESQQPSRLREQKMYPEIELFDVVYSDGIVT
jgi:hypothetical protein